jgi:nitrogen-specific signal transduction histidine kinase
MDQSIATQQIRAEATPILEMSVLSNAQRPRESDENDRDYMSSEDGVRPLVLLDSHFRIRSANRAFCNLFGLTSNVSNGTLLFDLGNHQWDNSTVRGLLADTQEGPEARERSVSLHIHEVGSCLLRLRAKRHKRRAPAVELIHLSVEDCLLLTLSDNADESAAREQNERMLAQTLTNLARDLNQSLALILGSAQILAQHTDEAVKDDAENIACAGSRVQAVLSMLVNQARNIERQNNPDLPHVTAQASKSLSFTSGDAGGERRSSGGERTRHSSRRPQNFLRIA